VNTLSVTAVVSFLREVLDSNEVFSDLWIEGEVSNYSRSQLGHRYFTLRDPGAALRAVMFRDRMPGYQLTDGERVIARGRVSIYVQRGELQFECTFVQAAGAGLMAARVAELTARLEAEGLFDAARKRPLPRFPRRIGVVTSPGGAALQDILNVLRRRWPLAEVVVSAALVQGEQAPAQITAALGRLAQEPGIEVVIVARGGGAAEDLAAFNDERVARAIYAFPAPVVSGVGHETDTTIADLVADLRAPTPSAAAERCTPDMAQVAGSLRSFDRGMAGAVRERVSESARDVEGATRRLQRAAPDPGRTMEEAERILAGMRARVERTTANERARFDLTAARLAALDPMATLKRGFAIVQREGPRKRVVTSVGNVRPGDRLSVSVADGAFWTEVS